MPTPAMNAQSPLNRLGVGLQAAGFRPAAAAGVLGLLVASGAIVAGRRLAGALIHPLPPIMLLVVAGLALAAAAAVRIGWSAPVWAGPYGRRFDAPAMLLASAAAAAILAGVCIGGTSAICMAVVATFWLAEEVWFWLCLWPRRGISENRLGRAFSGRVQASDENGDFLEAALTACDVPPSDVSEAGIPDDVTQQMTRCRTADGTETISGWVRSSFTTGQRTGVVHLSFCPPLNAVPELSVEQIDGPEARIKTSQLFSYGARLDLKLTDPADEPAAVVVQFMAREKAP